MSSVPGMDSYGIHGWRKQIRQMQSCKAVIGWDGPKKERIRIQVPEMSEVISDGKDSRCQIYIIMSSFKGDVLKILFTFDKNDSIVIELATFGGPEGYRRLWLDSLQPLSGGGAGRANKSQKWCNSQRIEAGMPGVCKFGIPTVILIARAASFSDTG